MVDTLELTSVLSYLRATRKELFAKLTQDEWEEAYELLTENLVHEWELEDIREESYDNGFADGQASGSDYDYDRGYDEGFSSGHEEGFEEGFEAGQSVEEDAAV